MSPASCNRHPLDGRDGPARRAPHRGHRVPRVRVGRDRRCAAAGRPRPRRRRDRGSALRTRDHGRHAGSRESPRSPSGGIASSDRAAVEIADAAADPARVATASALFADETALSRFATILDDTSLITGPERAEILQLLGVAWLADPTTWSTAVAAHRARDGDDARTRWTCCRPARSTCSARAPISGSGCATTCPIPSTSSSTRRPTISGSTCSARPRSSPAPQSNTRVEVPVQARVGNGEVTLALQLRSRASVADRRRRDRRGERARGMGERRHRRALGRRRRAARARRRAHRAAAARARRKARAAAAAPSPTIDAPGSSEPDADAERDAAGPPIPERRE